MPTATTDQTSSSGTQASGWFSSLSSLLNTGANVYNTVTGKPTTTTGGAPSIPNGTASSWTAYLPLIIIGALVLIGGLFFLTRK